MSDVFGLALIAAVYPSLFAAVTVMLVMPNPKRLLLGYVLGGYTMSITVGLVAVFALQNEIDASKRTLGPGGDIAVGLLFLLLAYVLSSGRDERLAERRRRKHPQTGPPRWERVIGKGSPRVTFVVGAMLSLPSVSYLVALGKIDQLDYSTPGTVALVVAFNLIMFALIELPLLGYLISPEKTRRAVDRFREWLRRSGRNTAVKGLMAIGVLMILRAVIGILTT